MNTPDRISMAHLRSRMITALRDFFLTREYLEADTPILSPSRIPEAHIDLFETDFESPFLPNKNLSLLPSPEIWMKRLIAEGFPSCFQITKSFRNAEQLGGHHNPEFTMLEWYTLDAGYFDSMKLTEELLLHLAELFQPAFDCSGPRIISMQTLVEDYTGIDLKSCSTGGEFEHALSAHGFDIHGRTWEEMFNKLFLLHVEPHLPDYPVAFVYDYPDQIPCLAKLKNNTPCRERWELYIQGIEIANCYTEETDPKKVKEFIGGEITDGPNAAGEIIKRETTPGAEVNTDWEIADVSGRMPPCSGAALGVDRLLMAFTGIRDIREVILFPFVDF